MSGFHGRRSRASGEGGSRTSNREHSQHLVAVVVDHLDRDLAGIGHGEWAADRAVEASPRGFIDLGAQGALQLLVRLIGAGEVRVADEEALAVVVRVDDGIRIRACWAANPSMRCLTRSDALLTGKPVAGSFGGGTVGFSRRVRTVVSRRTSIVGLPQVTSRRLVAWRVDPHYLAISA